MGHPGFVWVMLPFLGKVPPQMQDKELYAHLFDLIAAWTVSVVKLDIQS
jgi:hypothetical protein